MGWKKLPTAFGKGTVSYEKATRRAKGTEYHQLNTLRMGNEWVLMEKKFIAKNNTLIKVLKENSTIRKNKETILRLLKKKMK